MVGYILRVRTKVTTLFKKFHFQLVGITTLSLGILLLSCAVSERPIPQEREATIASVATLTASTPAPRPTFTPTPVPLPTSTPEPVIPTSTPEPTLPPIGHRSNPVPFGEVAQIGEWRVRVLSVTPDAGDLVRSENRFNDPPEDGHQFYFARVQATYVGPESASLWLGVSFNAVGDSAVGYNNYQNSCGLLADSLASTSEVFTGGIIEGNICWEIRKIDADSLLMYLEPFFSLTSERIFMSLDGPKSTSNSQLFPPTKESVPNNLVFEGRLGQITEPFYLKGGVAELTTTYLGGQGSEITVYLSHADGEDVALIAHGRIIYDSLVEVFIEEAGYYLLDIQAGDGVWTIEIAQSK